MHVLDSVMFEVRKALLQEKEKLDNIQKEQQVPSIPII